MPVLWKRVGVLRSEVKAAELMRLNLYALLFMNNGLHMKEAVICFMLPNGSEKLWDYAATVVTPVPEVGFRLLRKAAQTIKNPKPPKPNPDCGRCAYIRAVKKYL